MNYYIRKSGVVSGPFPEEDVRRRLSMNLLTSMDEASMDGRNWQRIRQTPLWRPANAPAPTTPPKINGPITPATMHQRRIAVRKSESPRSEVPPYSVGGGSSAGGWPIEQDARFSSSDSATPSPPPIQVSLPTYTEEQANRDIYRERPRFRNWWLALAIPCATLIIICIIGALMPSEPVPGAPSEPSPPIAPSEARDPTSSGDSGSPATSTDPSVPPTDDGYRGEEITHLQLDHFKPEFHDFLLYITPSYSELKQAFQMVLSSDHVSENLAYANATRDVRFYHDPSQDTINAFATVVDSWHREEPEFWPSIMVCGGAGRFARVIGAALTELGDELDIDALLGALGSVGSLDNEQARLILAEALHVPMERYSDPAWLSRAKGVSRGILMSILAHETGHIALGHVWAWQKNTERNRNQEREADSFAHSIASGTADAEIMFFGNFLFHYAYAINEGRDENSAMAQTHPYAEERLYNLIRDNKSIADLYGITETEIREQLREVRSKFR